MWGILFWGSRFESEHERKKPDLAEPEGFKGSQWWSASDTIGTHGNNRTHPAMGAHNAGRLTGGVVAID